MQTVDVQILLPREGLRAGADARTFVAVTQALARDLAALDEGLEIEIAPAPTTAGLTKDAIRSAFGPR
jgi:hypothetical protein